MSANEDILLISEELKQIADNEKIKCKVSYIEGVTRGIQLERDRKLRPVINAIEECLKKTEE
jgi:hypothetical protein